MMLGVMISVGFFSGMDNGIETPDDLSMEINPRDVLQVGGSSGSSVPSVNREVPEIM